MCGKIYSWLNSKSNHFSKKRNVPGLVYTCFSPAKNAWIRKKELNQKEHEFWFLVNEHTLYGDFNILVTPTHAYFFHGWDLCTFSIHDFSSFTSLFLRTLLCCIQNLFFFAITLTITFSCKDSFLGGAMAEKKQFDKTQDAMPLYYTIIHRSKQRKKEVR